MVARLRDAEPGFRGWVDLYHLESVPSRALNVLNHATLKRVRMRRFEIAQEILDGDWDPAGSEERYQEQQVEGLEALESRLADWGVGLDDLMPSFKCDDYPY